MRRFLPGIVLLLLATLAALLGAGNSLTYAQAQAQEPGTEGREETGIACTWVSALDAHDLDGAVALLDDGAYLILTSPPPSTDLNTYEGKTAIRGVLQQYIQDSTRTQIIDGPQVINGTTTWTERQSGTSWRALGLDYVEVAVDAIIEGGKIKSIIYELTPESAARVDAAVQAHGSQTGTMGMPRTGTDNDFPARLSVLIMGALVLIIGGCTMLALPRGVDRAEVCVAGEHSKQDHGCS